MKRSLGQTNHFFEKSIIIFRFLANALNNNGAIFYRRFLDIKGISHPRFPNKKAKRQMAYDIEILQRKCAVNELSLIIKPEGTKKGPIAGTFKAVVWGGIEPPTQGFSVLCSTD